MHLHHQNNEYLQLWLTEPINLELVEQEGAHCTACGSECVDILSTDKIGKTQYKN